LKKDEIGVTHHLGRGVQMGQVLRRRVTLDSPFDLDVTVDSWVFPDIQPTPEWKAPGQFGRCLPVEGRQVPVRVVQLRKGARPQLAIEWPATWSGDEDALVQRVAWLLGWDVETKPVLRVLRADPTLARIAEPLSGLRPFTQPTFLEALVKAVLQQQVTYRFACQMSRELVLRHGTHVELGSVLLHGFPPAERLAGLSDADLRDCKVGYKAPYVREIAQRITGGTLDLDAVAQKEAHQALRELDELPGVGRWTAELAVLSGLRRLEVFPKDDLGIRNIISTLYLHGKPAKRKEVEAVAERWGTDAPLVLYYLMCAQVLHLL
jgi:DNA-3-methyladenine glycosylase II